MIYVELNDGKVHEIEFSKDGATAQLNGKQVNWDIKANNDGGFHILFQHASCRIDVLNYDKQTKQLDLSLNGYKISTHIKTETDRILQAMGFDATAVLKINEVKAPMPGMVLRLLTHEGDTVKKGDGLLVLEAMKMENIIKSPSDGIIKKIVAELGKAVEKNQLLISFE